MLRFVQPDKLEMANLTLSAGADVPLLHKANLVAYFFEIKQEKTPSLETARRKVLSK